MTEQEWDTTTDIKALLNTVQHDQYLRRYISNNRKLTLFTTACCRQYIAGHNNARAQEILNDVDNYVDDKDITYEQISMEYRTNSGTLTPNRLVQHCLNCAIIATTKDPQTKSRYISNIVDQLHPKSRYIRDIFHDIFMSPYTLPKPSSLECKCNGTGWRYKVDHDNAGSSITYPCKQCNIFTHNDNLALNLAQTIYNTQDYSIMPILGDALEDAGCTNQVILDHARNTKVCTECAYNTQIACPHCNGIGDIVSPLLPYQPCPHCKGTGYMPQRYCHNCKTTGKTTIPSHHKGCWLIDTILNKQW